MATLLVIKRTTHTYQIELDGKSYKVTHDIPHRGDWPERWTVLSYIGDNFGTRECDSAKPTHKRVVAAVQAAFGAKSLTEEQTS